MARLYKEYQEDQKMLSKLSIGDKVKYKNKVGIISIFVEYKGSYSYGYKQFRIPCKYTAVVMHLDDGKSHINVSPRNLKMCN